MSAAFWFMIAVLGTAGIAFISVVVWVDGRAKEREAHYRNETVKKITESGNSAAALEYLRAVEIAESQRARIKARISGLTTAAVGVALMIFLYMLVPASAVYLSGLIPLLVGVALLIASEFMMKPTN